jgi:hypothetical protein
VNAVTSWWLWVSAGLYGLSMLWIRAAWQAMARLPSLANRLGSVALVGSLVAWLGDDRLGLTRSEQGALWSTIALGGVFLCGTGWVVLGAVLVSGAGAPVPSPEPRRSSAPAASRGEAAPRP